MRKSGRKKITVDLYRGMAPIHLLFRVEASLESEQTDELRRSLDGTQSDWATLELSRRVRRVQ